jgi:hypothetical protein
VSTLYHHFASNIGAFLALKATVLIRALFEHSAPFTAFVCALGVATAVNLEFQDRFDGEKASHEILFFL